MACRAIAGDKEMQVGFGAGKPDLQGHAMTLPEPSRRLLAKPGVSSMLPAMLS